MAKDNFLTSKAKLTALAEQQHGTEVSVDEVRHLNIVKAVQRLDALAEFPALTAVTFSCATLPDLTGLQAVAGLKSLHFDRKTKVKKGVETIGAIESLEELSVGRALFADMKGWRLNHLRRLALHDNKLDDLAFLPELPALEVLRLGWQGCKLTSFATLPSMGSLLRLDCPSTKSLASCDGLQRCPKLRLLAANLSGLSDLGALSEHPGLERLELRGCSVQAVAELRKCPNLKQLYLERSKLASIEGIADNLAQLELLWIWGTKVKDLSPLEGMHHLRDLELAMLKPRGWTFLGSLRSLVSLDLAKTSFQDFELLEDLPKLAYVRLGADTVDEKDARARALNEKLAARGGGLTFSGSPSWKYDLGHDPNWPAQPVV